MTITEELRENAKKWAGNWRPWPSFGWNHRQLDIYDPDQWLIYHPMHRDSGLIDRSNTEVMKKALRRYTRKEPEDVVLTQFSHWAYGWVEAIIIRVYRPAKEGAKRRITNAFKKFLELHQAMEEYPVLDSEHLAKLEERENVQTIRSYAKRFIIDDANVPTYWEYEVLSWFATNDESALEDNSGQGCFPSDDQYKAALKALGWLHPDYDERLPKVKKVGRRKTRIR
jgi:hypothetical protein